MVHTKNTERLHRPLFLLHEGTRAAFFVWGKNIETSKCAVSLHVVRNSKENVNDWEYLLRHRIITYIDIDIVLIWRFRMDPKCVVLSYVIEDHPPVTSVILITTCRFIHIRCSGRNFLRYRRGTEFSRREISQKIVSSLFTRNPGRTRFFLLQLFYSQLLTSLHIYYFLLHVCIFIGLFYRHFFLYFLCPKLSIEGGSSRSHYVEESFWKRFGPVVWQITDDDESKSSHLT